MNNCETNEWIQFLKTKNSIACTREAKDCLLTQQQDIPQRKVIDKSNHNFRTQIEDPLRYLIMASLSRMSDQNQTLHTLTWLENPKGLSSD